MFKHILVPLDGSFFAEAALPAAVKIAHQFQATLTLLRVIAPHPQPSSVQGALQTMMINQRKQAYAKAHYSLRQYKTMLKQRNYNIFCRVIEGEPVANAILEFVLQNDIDLIVMSTHGRGGLARWYFGSVADRIAQASVVPTMFVRATDATVTAFDKLLFEDVEDDERE